MELKLNSAFTAVGKAEGKRIFTVRNREDVNRVIGYKCGQDTQYLSDYGFSFSGVASEP